MKLRLERKIKREKKAGYTGQDGALGVILRPIPSPFRPDGSWNEMKSIMKDERNAFSCDSNIFCNFSLQRG